jgi:hypothetical protein
MIQKLQCLLHTLRTIGKWEVCGQREDTKFEEEFTHGKVNLFMFSGTDQCIGL